MKGISVAERLVLDRLQTKPGLISKFLGKQSEGIDLLRQLEVIGDYAVIPHIFHLVFAGSETATQAAKTIHAIISRKPLRYLPSLEEIIHAHSAAYLTNTANYPKLKPSDIKTFKRFATYASTLLGIASFDANGYVREAAVRAIAELPSGEGIPYLLIRLNDWVQEVRHTADWALQDMIKFENAEQLLKSFDLVLRLARCQRDSHDNTINAILTLLKQPESRSLLWSKLEDKDFYARRQCLRILLEDAANDPLLLLERVKLHRDAFDYLIIAQVACSQATGVQLKQIYSLFKDTPFPLVRRVALESLAAWNAAESKDELWSALFDSNRMIRELSRKYLMRIGVSQEDMANAYREILRNQPDSALPSNILGLSEVGEPRDCELLLPHLADERVANRCSVIRALSRLSPDKFFPLFVEQLGSAEQGVSREAREAILKTAHLVDATALWSMFTEQTAKHVRHNLICIFNSLGKWDRLGLMLGVMGKGMESEKAFAYYNLQECLESFNSTFTSPSVTQIERIKAHLHVDVIGKQMMLQVEWMIKG